jgi:hypothetical protein
MLTEEQREFAGKSARVLQIIVAALITGPSIFIGYVLLADRDQQVPPNESMMFSYVGVALAFVSVIAALLVPRLIIARTRAGVVSGDMTLSIQQLPGAESAGDAGPLMAGYQTKTILAAALLEGAAFANAVFYLTQRQPICIATAIVLVICIATLFPFRGRVVAWLESELASIKQLRNFQN